jgi:hypothetical protein
VILVVVHLAADRDPRWGWTAVVLLLTAGLLGATMFLPWWWRGKSTTIGFIRSGNPVIPGTKTASTMARLKPSRTRPTAIRTPYPLVQSMSCPPRCDSGAVPTIAASAAPSTVAIHSAALRAWSARKAMASRSGEVLRAGAGRNRKR